MKVKAKLVDKLQFSVAADSNHAIIVDSGKKLSFDQGIRSKELLLVSLSTCTGMDVVSILNKMRVDFDDFQVTAKGDSAEEHPKVFTKIDLEYTIKGKEIEEKKFKKAIKLSQERYCPVSAMLNKICEMNYHYTINDH